VTDLARARQEADERWAAHTAGDEDQPLSLQIARLRTTGELLRHLGIRHRDRALRRRARRSLRAADDREQALRLERLLGHRGVVVLEAASFTLLLLVLLVLVVESSAVLSPGAAVALHWVDGVACALFLAEFLLRLLLAPRRWSFTWRHALTDLLPAVPAVLWLLPGPALPGAADDAIVLRLVRVFRFTWAARYVQALRPLLRAFRVVLLMVRGMDGLVSRFAHVLDRDFVFFEAPRGVPADAGERRDLVFAALRRQQVLCAALPAGELHQVLGERLAAASARAAALPGTWPEAADIPSGAREVPVEEAIEFLFALTAGDVGRWLPAADLRALDRAIAVLHAPPIGWLPLLRRFRVHPLPPSPEERVVALSRRVAEWLQGWHGRLQFFADLHGIVTGPQILDRVATGMIKASQRPAVRLILFGGLATLLDTLFTSNLLARFVGLPLLVLGSLCLVILLLGWWLKRIAGEASEAFRLTSEAHFVSLMHLRKRRQEPGDLRFLARRVFGDLPAHGALRLLRAQLDFSRAGVPVDLPEFGSEHERLAARVVLLYLHFLDGALLHASDIKTTEQLLANLSLENLRYAWLGITRKAKKRLRLLRLDDGSVFRGPFLWFRFITESVAVEASKRVVEYNRRCAPCAQVALQGPETAAWLQGRCDPKGGRTLERLPPPDAGTTFASSEFHVLDFLAPEPARDAWLASTFGADVVRALAADRRAMIREIFGMRPVHELPRAERTVNAWRFYWARLSHGRVFLLPLYALLRALRSAAWFVGRIRAIVREVLSPHLAREARESGSAPFAVALRKINRMKAPGLLEAIRLRLQIDPAYAGALPGWSAAGPGDDGAQLERDLDFLHLRERARAEFRALASRQRERAAQLAAVLAHQPPIAPAGAPPDAVADGELAVTVAWSCNRERVRTLLLAERWRDEVLPQLALRDEGGWWVRARALVADLFGEHPIERWCARLQISATPRLRSNLRRAYARDAEARAVIDAWLGLAPGATPAAVAIERLRRLWREGAALRRELGVLRAVQSLAVLDVRNYRALVFELGGYAADGEKLADAMELP
jgi:hypothetical protein